MFLFVFVTFVLFTIHTRWKVNRLKLQIMLKLFGHQSFQTDYQSTIVGVDAVLTTARLKKKNFKILLKQNENRLAEKLQNDQEMSSDTFFKVSDRSRYIVYCWS